jgi:DNA-binding response OmpR family regulator
MAVRIGVVDDEPLLLVLFGAVLEQSGYDYLCIARARGALEALAAYTPDLMMRL